MLVCVSNAQEKRALVIGIGDYPSESGWNKIHGNNDVRLIHQTLLSQGFHDNNIIQLIDSEATYENILSKMQILLDSASKNDVVYVHFSGHGQRITDLNGDESKDRLDESWVPYDACKIYTKGVYEGERHIIDDFLNEYFTKLRIKVGYGGKIIVVADACHSGSSTRGLGNDESFKRGGPEVFIIPKEAANIIRKENPVDWLFVAACKDFQTNYEYRDSVGEYYGSLTYSIAQSNDKISDIKYTEAIDLWEKYMDKITIYPQNIENEGKPSKMNNNLF